MPNIIKIDPIDISSRVESEVTKAKNFLKEAGNMIVSDLTSAEAATAKAKDVKELSRNAENMRTTLKEPFLKAGKLIDSEFKRVTEPCAEAEKQLKSKILVFQQEENRKAREREAELRRQAEEEALKEAEALAAQGDTREAERVIERAMDRPPVMSEARGPIRSSGGAAAGIRKTWTFEVTDEKLVPRQYLVVDEKAVKAAIAAGERSIPGIRIFEKETVAIS